MSFGARDTGIRPEKLVGLDDAPQFGFGATVTLINIGMEFFGFLTKGPGHRRHRAPEVQAQSLIRFLVRVDFSLRSRGFAASGRFLEEIEQVDFSPTSLGTLIDFAIEIFKTILNEFEAGFQAVAGSVPGPHPIPLR